MLLRFFGGALRGIQKTAAKETTESKAESYKTTHNFFDLEEGRSNSLLQTYKLIRSIKRNIVFQKYNTCCGTNRS